MQFSILSLAPPPPSFLGGVSNGVSEGVSGVLVKVLVTSNPLSVILSGLLTEFSGRVVGGGGGHYVLIIFRRFTDSKKVWD